MENYSGASASRYLDVQTLLDARPQRVIAAIHLGGIAVECQLKALILSYHRIKDWSDKCSRPKDSRFGQQIERPGHHLLTSLKLMEKVYSRAKADPLFLRHLARVMHPAGHTEADFIAFRYETYDFSEKAVSDWEKSIHFVRRWLEKNVGHAE